MLADLCTNGELHNFVRSVSNEGDSSNKRERLSSRLNKQNRLVGVPNGVHYDRFWNLLTYCAEWIHFVCSVTLSYIADIADKPADLNRHMLRNKMVLHAGIRYISIGGLTLWCEVHIVNTLAILPARRVYCLVAFLKRTRWATHLEQGAISQDFDFRAFKWNRLCVWTISQAILINLNHFKSFLNHLNNNS